MLADYPDLGLYLDEMQRENESLIAIELEADGSLDGYNGTQPKHPQDADYLRGYTMGSLARNRERIEQLEHQTRSLQLEVQHLSCKMTCTGHRLQYLEGEF
jgi:adenylosuccinate lyase